MTHAPIRLHGQRDELVARITVLMVALLRTSFHTRRKAGVGRSCALAKDLSADRIGDDDVAEDPTFL